MRQIADWLNKLGMSEYAERFARDDIDLDVLPELTDQDFDRLGVSVGHRRKMLRAIRGLAGAAAAAPQPAAAAAPVPQDRTERRQLTVTFCDLVGSTALSARLDPEELREIIGAYHRRCADVIAKSGGFVAKYMGDGVLAYFGYPQAHEDDAERAVGAGLALVEAMAKLDARGGKALQVRVGIATGLVVVGDLVGEGAAQEQAVVGETPNLAGRLQALAEPNTVIIDGDTRRLLGELFEYRALGPVSVKGFDDPVAVWRVLGASKVDSRFEALRSGVTPLVGRDEELELLLRRWQQVKSGKGRVVLITGEPGIGKSRLTAALQEHLQHDSHTRLRHFCSLPHQDSALRPVISQLERAAGLARDDTAEEKLAKLETLLAQSNAQPDEIGLIAELLSIPNRGHYSVPELSPQKRKEKTLMALLAQLERLAARQPVLAVYEDAHWIDPTTLELLTLMIEQIQNIPVLLLITARPEFKQSWPAYRHVTSITLGRIGRDEGALLVGQVTAGKALPGEVLQQILARTDGVPLFIEELTKAVVESGALTDAGDRYTVTGSLPPLAIPTSLNASLLARLDRLAPVREVAQVGAALGRSFSHELISAIAPMPQQQLDDALAQLVRAELIFQRGVPPNAEYSFKHALVQDAAYSTLLHSRRQQLHARIAAVIEGHFPEIVAAQPALVAQHCAQAGLPESAIKYWTAAGDSAELRGMVHEAVAHYRAAITLFSPTLPAAIRAHEPDLLMKLGSALQQAQGYGSQATLEAYQHARTIAFESDQLEKYAKAGIGLALLLACGCQYREALNILGQISEDSLDQLEPQTRVHLLAVSSVANYGSGEYEKAWDLAVAACALDDGVVSTHRNPIGGGDPAIVSRAYAVYVGTTLGYFERCLSLAEQALTIAHERNHAYTVAWALLVLGRLYCTLGRFTDALSLGTEAIGLCERHGFHARMGTILIVMGRGYFGLGDVERGSAEIRRGLKLWRDASGRFHTSWLLSEFADCLMRAEKFDEVDAVLCEAEQVVAETDERSHVAELIRLRGLLLTQRGQLRHGTAQLLRAVEWSQPRSAKLFELRAMRDLARIQMSQGQSGRAIEKLLAVVSSFPSALEMPDLKEAKALLDQLA